MPTRSHDITLALSRMIELLSSLGTKIRSMDAKDYVKRDSSGSFSSTVIRMPYIGWTPADVCAFGVSAAVLTTHFWFKRWILPFFRPRKRRDGSDGRSTSQSGRRVDSTADARAREWEPYKDEKLHAFMEKAKEKKTMLRKVQDPEVSRSQKLREIKQNVSRSPWSENLLRSTRNDLKTVGRDLTS